MTVTYKTEPQGPKVGIKYIFQFTILFPTHHTHEIQEEKLLHEIQKEKTN